MVPVVSRTGMLSRWRASGARAGRLLRKAWPELAEKWLKIKGDIANLERFDDRGRCLRGR